MGSCPRGVGAQTSATRRRRRPSGRRRGPPGVVLGAGLAGLAWPDVRGRRRRLGVRRRGLAFLPLSKEAPPTGRKCLLPRGSESGSSRGCARDQAPGARGEAGGGAGHTWRRREGTCGVQEPRQVQGAMKAPASYLRHTGFLIRALTSQEKPFQPNLPLILTPGLRRR